MQCLQVKQMAPSAQGGDRYRLVMSDGRHYVQTMLATQANHVVHDGKLTRGCLARIKQYTPNNLKGKKCVAALLRRRRPWTDTFGPAASSSSSTSKSSNLLASRKRLASPSPSTPRARPNPR